MSEAGGFTQNENARWRRLPSPSLFIVQTFLEIEYWTSKKTEGPGKYRNALNERIGQISRFFRAALTITAFRHQLIQEVGTIIVQPLPPKKYKVTSLHGRTIEDLRFRGDQRFSSCKDD